MSVIIYCKRTKLPPESVFHVSVLSLTIDFAMHVTMSTGQSCGCQIVHSYSLRGHRINNKFMCLSIIILIITQVIPHFDWFSPMHD